MPIKISIVSTFDDSGIKKAAREFQRAEGTIAKSGAVIRGLGPVADRAGLALVGAGVLGVRAASEQEQAYGALESIYGSSADEMIAWSKSSRTIGTSSAAAASAAATLGASLINAGMSTSDAADRSQVLIERAADMAAVFGGTTTDAIGAVSAALRGETDPIERYGVSMRAADIEARALSMGLVQAEGSTAKIAAAQVRQEKAQTALADATRTYGADSIQAREASARLGLAQEALAAATEGTVPELTAAQKQAAALDIIMGQTASSSGAAARELDTVAGSTAQAKADIEDAGAAIWTALGPAVADVAGKLAEMARWASDNAGAMQALVGGIGAVVAAIKIANIAMGIHQTVSSLINILNGRREGSSRRAARATDIDTAALGRNTTAKSLNAAADAAGGRAAGAKGRATRGAAKAASAAAGADAAAAAATKTLAKETGQAAAKTGAMRVASVGARGALRAVPYVGTALLVADLARATGATERAQESWSAQTARTSAAVKRLGDESHDTRAAVGLYGQAGATAAPKINTLGSKSTYAGTQAAATGTKTAGATPSVSGYGAAASAAATKVDTMGSKASTAATNTGALGSKSSTAATSIDKAKTAADKAALKFGPMSTEAEAARKEVADLQAAADKAGVGNLGTKAGTAKTNIGSLKTAADNADGPVETLGTKSNTASSGVSALSTSAYNASNNASNLAYNAAAAYTAVGNLAQRLRNEGAGGAWGVSPGGRAASRWAAAGRSGRAIAPTIIVQGALDPDGVARQIGRIMSARIERSGQSGVRPAW